MFKQSRISYEKRLLLSLIIVEILWLIILSILTIKYFIPAICIAINSIQTYFPLLAFFLISKIYLIMTTNLIILRHQI